MILGWVIPKYVNKSKINDNYNLYGDTFDIQKIYEEQNLRSKRKIQKKNTSRFLWVF